MPTTIDTVILDQYCCLEPEVGEHLLFLYPEFLSSHEKQMFERHLQGCESCRERRKLWLATGLGARMTAMLQQITDLVTSRHYFEAIDLYNVTLEIQPTLLDSAEGEACFKAGAWLSPTAARSQDLDITPYLAPGYAPERYEMAAAKTGRAFPLAIEYADGKVKGKISTAGRLVFFEVVEVSEEFAAGVTLVGKVLKPVTMLKTWEIIIGKKQRLGVLSDLFESVELTDIINTLKRFRVFPI